MILKYKNELSFGGITAHPKVEHTLLCPHFGVLNSVKG